MRHSLFAVSVLVLLFVPAAHSEQTSLPGCEAPAPLRKTIKDQLEVQEFRHLPYQEQQERRQRVLSALIAKYPREVVPYRHLILHTQIVREYDPDPLTAIQTQLRERKVAHPDDPLALYLYASALRGTDTPESIRMLEKAQSLAPDFVWPSLDLAQIYSSGKFADKQQFTDQLRTFFTACPTSQDMYARWMLVKVPKLQAKVARAERTSLETTKDPERLKDYEFLWGMEFRTASPKDFPTLRKQVAADVRRLESTRNPHPDAEWMQLLIIGEKQAGASPASVTASEDALIARYPHSNEAYRITEKRWEKVHPEPDAKDTAGWKKHNADWRDAIGEWMTQYPDRFYPADYSRFFYVSDDDTMDEQQGLAMVEAFLKASARQYGDY